MRKVEARSRFGKMRAELPLDILGMLSARILERFEQLDLSEIRTVHCYLSSVKGREVETASLIAYLRTSRLDRIIVVPKIVSSTEFINTKYEGQPLAVQNRWGIPEPIDGVAVGESLVDTAIVPLLAYDEAGYRVGYGGGYYDRFLKKCRPGIPIVGLSFFDPVPAITDSTELDVRMTHCITPDRVIAF